jgi:chemotaxis protein histidine kinase CheA
MNHHNSAIDAAEAELQQELREMFAIDTQQHLDTYFSLIQQLNPDTWVGDIQHLYRAIHTVKGGAMTVAADAMLQVAAVLEDILSDLRYLETAPPLENGELAEILLEAGELLSSSVEASKTDEQSIEQVQPTVRRLEELRDRIKQLYLVDWNELKQVHQEFAEQAFDLVILDLEIALSNLPHRGIVAAKVIDTAEATISQLAQIGVELELAQDWTGLLQCCQQLIIKSDCQVWQTAWTEYFQLLKSCAKNSGELDPSEHKLLAELTNFVGSIDINLGSSNLETSIELSIEAIDDISGSLDMFFFDKEEVESSSDLLFKVRASTPSDDLSGSLDMFFFDEEEVESFPALSSDAEAPAASNDLSGSLDMLFADEGASYLDVSATIADIDISGDLSGSLSHYLFEAEIDSSLALSLDAETTQSSSDLSGSLADFFFEEEEIESTGSLSFELDIAESSNDLSALIDLDIIEVAKDKIETSLDISTDIQNIESISEMSGSLDLISVKVADEIEIYSSITADPDSITNESSLDSLDVLNNLPDLLDDLFSDSTIEVDPVLPAIIAEIATPAQPVVSVKRSIQIPVPLERLDKSAQQVVDTLLAARAVMSVSNTLKSQLDRLTTLTRESSQFVTRLRQLQDDYALLRNLSDEQKDSGNNVTMERYRQGYTTINRLLENILRLSELGQEIEASTYQSSTRLDALDRSILQLKDGIEASRLVPFRNLSLRSKAILRDLTNRYGKPAELIVENEQIELDAGIIQQLEPALLHLLRNAYDHGLESTQQRSDAGKKPQGMIVISLQQQGNLYRLTIEDDGAGIDAKLIHQLAQSKGFPLNQTRTNAELLAVLCQPGFSSNSSINDISGRGVGLDVVVAQIASIGGKLSMETYPGHGTKFSIEIPAPQLLIPCVLFQVGDRIVAVPTDNVLETALLSSLTIEPIDLTSENKLGMCTWNIINLRGEIPGFDLNNYWQLGNSNIGKSTHRIFPDTAVCIRTRQAEDTPDIWSIADDLLGQAKLLINPLPSPLIAPVGLLGVSLQPDGKLISILDPIALSAMITSTVDARNERLRQRSATADLGELEREDTSTETAPASAPTILIVDDAAMIRRRLESSLNTYGFITHTCNDGLEALNWLLSNPAPDLMITDVEMPNMDGFTLIDRARQAKIDIPILVVSSRLSEEWGKEARRLGATDYLNKGFGTSELLQKVNSLLGLLVDA